MRLSPFALRLTEHLRRTGLLLRGDRVLAAVSGGPDSVALLLALAESQRVLGLSDLRVAHTNHGMRGKASDADARFVSALARRLGFSCDVVRVRLSPKSVRDDGAEAAARAVRYAALAKIARARRCNAIATGHQADDLAETVIWRILRGTSVEGLAGIPPSRMLSKGIRLVRPLLPFPRREIDAYVRSVRPRTTPRRDASNRSADFLRNRVRRTLLPVMERVLPGARQAIARLSASAREASEAIGFFAGRAWKESAKVGGGRVTIARGPFAAQPFAVQGRVLRHAVSELRGPAGRLDRTHFDVAARVLSSGRGGADLPGGLRIEAKGATAIVFRPSRRRRTK